MIEVDFQAEIRKLLDNTTKRFFGTYLEQKTLEALQFALLVSLLKRLEDTTSWDSTLRFEDAFRHLSGLIVDTLVASASEELDGNAIKAVAAWRTELSTKGADLYRSLRKQATSGQDNAAKAKENMGATYAVYECVRNDAGVAVRRGDVASGHHERSIGSSVSAIRETLRDGRMVHAMERMLA